MREVLHIFRKDVRALWPQILVVLAASALPIIDRDEQHTDKLIGILALARWYFIVCAIHQEKLVGDREWWLTRPNSWKALLGAKLLLIAAFVQVPLLLSDITILTSNGLPLAGGTLAGRQAELALALILPAAALAAVTEGLVSFGLGVLVILICIFTPAANDVSLARWGPLVWIPPALVIGVLSLAAVVLLFWQYGRRRTLQTRSLFGGATLLCSALLIIPPSNWGVAIATHMLRPPAEIDALRLQWDRAVPPLVVDRPRGEVMLRVPLHIAGLPDGMLVQPDLTQLAIDSPDGTHWSTGWRAPFFFPGEHWSQWHWTGPRDAGLDLVISRSVLDRVQKERATWRLSVALTVLGRERSQEATPSALPFTVPGFGVCTLGPQMVYGHPLTCRNSASPPDDVAIAETGYQFSRPADWLKVFSLGPSPLWSTMTLVPLDWKGPSITFLMRRPVAHIRRDLVEQIRLEDYR